LKRYLPALLAAISLAAQAAPTEKFGFKGVELGSGIATLASNPKYECRTASAPGAGRVDAVADAAACADAGEGEAAAEGAAARPSRRRSSPGAQPYVARSSVLNRRSEPKPAASATCVIDRSPCASSRRAKCTRRVCARRTGVVPR